MNCRKTVHLWSVRVSRAKSAGSYAFMSLIAERLAADSGCSFDMFVSKNPDLMSKDVLMRWYAGERLGSDMAREIFLLPEAARSAAAQAA